MTIDLPTARLIACPAPALPPVIDAALPAGGSIADMLAIAGADPALARYGIIHLVDPRRPDTAVVVPRELWARVRPKAGMVIVATVRPAGGGGGGGGKNPLRTVLTLAVVVAAAAVTWGVGSWLAESGMAWATTVGANGIATLSFAGQLVAGLAGAAVTMLGSLAINALIPPARDAVSEYQAGSADATRYTLTGTRNGARPWQTIRKVMGRRRVSPDLWGEMWREVVGDKTYVRIPLLIAEGPLKLSDWRVGDTPLDDIKGVELEVREGWEDDGPITLYANDRHTEGYTISLTAEAGWFQRRSAAAADELVWEVCFPRGLARVSGESSREAASVELELQYAPAGSDAWVPVVLVDGSTTITDKVIGTTVLRSLRSKAAGGQYDTRMRRVTPDATSNSVIDTCQWVSLSTITYRDSITVTGVARAVLRVEAGEETSGVLDQVSCLAEAYAKVPDGAGGWVWALTRNPADWFIDALTRWSAEPCAYDELHLPSLADWRAECATLDSGGAAKWCFDVVYEQDVTLRQVLLDICAAGRARLAAPEGKLGVVRDVVQAAPTQCIGPAISWGFREREVYTDLPHGLRVRFEDETNDYKVDEVYYLAPGYDASTATRWEVLETVGVTRHAQTYRLGRYHYACAIHRPTTYETHTNIAQLDYEEGDLVEVQHPVILAGLVDAFVVEVLRNDAGRVVAVRIDDQATMEAGVRYGVRLRRRGSGIRVTDTVEVICQPGETDTLTFAAPLAIAYEPMEDDYLQFGVLGQVGLAAIVSRITPEADMGAMLTLLDAAPEIVAADDGPIPDRSVIMTPRPGLSRPAPAAVPMVSITSDESVMAVSSAGAPIPRIVIALAPPDGTGLVPTHYDLAVRLAGALTWAPRPAQPYGTRLVIDDVAEGAAYDIRWRPVTDGGLAGEWRSVEGHVVVGKSSPPPSPTALYVERLPGGAMRYRVVGDRAIDHAGWRWRQRLGISDAWPGAADAWPGLDTVGQIEVAAFAARTYTIMVRAVDTSGNESVGMASALVQLGDVVTTRVIDSHDLGAQGWPGEVAGGLAAGGALVAAAAEAMWTDARQPLFSDPYAALISTYQAMVYTASILTARRGALTLDWTAAGTDLAILYRRVGVGALWLDPFAPLTDDAGAPVVGTPDWIAYLGPVLVDAGETIGIRVAAAGGAVAARFDRLVAAIDAEVVTLHIEDLAIPPGGARLPLSRSLAEVVRVGLTLQQADGYPAIRVVVADKSAAGPLIYAYDAAGAPAAALIDADVVGVPA